MKIAISGTTGFIGKNLTEYYQGYEIQHINRVDPYGCLNIFKPNLIIHCAAEIYDSDAMFDSNVLLTKQYLDWLRDNPIARMIHIGSSSEYGPVNRPTDETDCINPVDMYQATKGMATILCQGYARSYKLDIRIVRPYSVYGKYEKPHRLFPRLWKAFMLNQSMTLHEGFHDFIYINDFIRGVDLIAKDKEYKPGEIVNLGSGQQYSNSDVLSAFNRVTGKIAPVTEIGIMAKSFESSVWICNPTYAKSVYNFECQYDLDSGVRDFINSANYQKEV